MIEHLPEEVLKDSPKEISSWLPQYDTAAKLVAQNRKESDILKITGLSRKQFLQIRNHPAFVDAVNREASKPVEPRESASVMIARQILENAAAKAAEKVVALACGEVNQDKRIPLRIQLEASKDILDRVGLKAKLSIDAEVKRAVDQEELEQTKQTLEEIRSMVSNINSVGNPFVIKHTDG